MDRPANSLFMEYLANALSALAAHLPSEEALPLYGQAAAALIQADSKLPAPNRLPQELSTMLAHELPPQMLVDLLKHPCCVRSPQRVVLDALARYYQRPFADQWDFVDYVEQQKLDLDLTTPAARRRPPPPGSG